MDTNTPEKVPRTPTERKRKRKEDSGGAAAKGVRTSSDKKINDYFRNSGNSPIRHGGAKSPSPQQPYPMVCIKFCMQFMLFKFYFNFLIFLFVENTCLEFNNFL